MCITFLVMNKHEGSQSVDDDIYAPSWGLSTLAKEFTAVARIMQSLFERIEHSGI